MRNWRTSLFGAVGALGVATVAYVMSNPNVFAKWPWVVPTAGIIAASGILGQGLVGKDAAVHSTENEVEASTTKAQIATIKSLNP
jgi:hypothetical protein